jgi:hypothetical protein
MPLGCMLANAISNAKRPRLPASGAICPEEACRNSIKRAICLRSIFDRIAGVFVDAEGETCGLRFGLAGAPAPMARGIAARR